MYLNPKPASPGKPSDVTSRWPSLTALGPGLVFLVSSIGPRDLVSNSVAGANYGYSLLWTLLAVGLARFVIVEATARYVVATGESLLSGYRRIGAWAGWLILGAIVLKRHFSNLYHMLLLGLAIGLLFGFDGRGALALATLASAGLAFAVMYGGGYRSVERWSKPLAALLGVPLLVTIVLSKPDLGEVVEGVLHPATPEATAGYGPALVILMLIEAGVGSLSTLKYSAYIYEKGWRSISYLRRQRLDLMVSVIGTILVSALIQIAAATVLRPQGLDVESAEQLIPMYTAVLGPTGQVLLSIGLWFTVFTTYMGSNTGYSLIAADVLEAAAPKRAWLAEGNPAASRRKVFRLFLVGFCVTPIYVVWTDWEPIPILVLATVLLAVVLPLVTLVLLRLTADRRIMKEHANRWYSNLGLAVVVVTSIYASFRTAMELLER